MKNKAPKSSSAEELQFELKYCERCGGLWLRPAGGGQVYCEACGRAMAELPLASYDRGTGGARMPIGPGWDADDSEVECYEEYDLDFDELDFDELDFDDLDFEGLDFDAAGGVA